jgi:hypothetical protein
MPVHAWPGDITQEIARYFDQLLDQVLRAGSIGEYSPTAR